MERPVAALALLLGLAVSTGAQPGADDPGAAWDRRYDRPAYVYGTEPVTFLREALAGMPAGRALVLAAGEGRNAVWLARQGWAVTAVDVSPRGLAKARALAAEHEVSIRTVVADLDTFDLGRRAWDLVTLFYFHDAELFAPAMAALRPGGHFILQHFSLDQPGTNRFGPSNPDWLLAPNELTRAFDGWRIRRNLREPHT